VLSLVDYKFKESISIKIKYVGLLKPIETHIFNNRDVLKNSLTNLSK